MANHPQVDNYLLAIAVVIIATSLSKATIYRSIKSGTFPAPVKISARRVGWRSSDIAKFVAGDWEVEASL